MNAQHIRAASILPDRNTTVVARELAQTIKAQRLHLPQSRVWRTLEMRRKALGLELALTAPDTFAGVILKAGPL